MNATEWSQQVDSAAARLDELLDRGDWEALASRARDFTALLAEAPRGVPATRPALERAQALVERLLPAAQAARASLGVDIKQVSRGRKAVSAYR